MLEVLFDGGVVSVVADDAMWDADLPEAEAAVLAHARQKRRREFTAGRTAARAALAQLGIKDVVLLPAEDRTPIWPAGVVGSISHTKGFCGAAVARTRDFTSIGIDVEQSAPLKEALIEKVCAAADLGQLARLPGDPQAWAKVVFSAKEAMYKCYYPIARTYLGFHDVALSLFPEDETFEARIINADKPSAAGLRTFRGRFRRDESYIYAGCAIAAAP